jgi:hypothetical protein
MKGRKWVVNSKGRRESCFTNDALRWMSTAGLRRPLVLESAPETVASLASLTLNSLGNSENRGVLAALARRGRGLRLSRVNVQRN